MKNKVFQSSILPAVTLILYNTHCPLNRYSSIFDLYSFSRSYQPINYLFDIFQYILLPIYSFIRLIVSSFDVIHTIGFYSLGIKIDAIPGKINSTTTLRLLIKGEYRGKCFELCGQGHLLMMSSTIVYLLLFHIFHY